jgi:hypothetical protein
MNTCFISKDNKQQELQQIKIMLEINKYTPHILKNKKLKNNKHKTINTEKPKLGTFTYIGRETRTIARHFKNTNLRLGYTTKNTIQNHLQPRRPNTEKHSKSGLYKLSCKECQLQYIGKGGRNFKIRYEYKEHIQATRNNKPISKHSQHVLNIQHTYNTIKNMA